MPCLYCRKRAKCLEGEIAVIGVVLLADVCGSVANGIHGIIEELDGLIGYDVTDLLPFVVFILLLDAWVILTDHTECLDVVDALLDHLVGVLHVIASIVHLGNNLGSCVVSHDGHALLDAQVAHLVDEVGGGQVALIDDRLDVDVIVAPVDSHQGSRVIISEVEPIDVVDEPSRAMLHE
jgi:hypothetical protein